MAKNIQPKVRVPRKLKKGQIFEVKCMVSHDMESGQRTNKETGAKIPRDIINKLMVVYNGKTVLHADWHPGLSANPFTSFFVIAEEAGTMDFTWTDDAGNDYKKSVKINVT